MCTVASDCFNPLELTVPCSWCTYSLIGSFVPFGGFFSSPLDPRSPMKSENQHSSCYLCTEKFEHEVAAILKEQSITSVADQCPGKLPSWLERAELDTRKGVDMAKVCQSLKLWNP